MMTWGFPCTDISVAGHQKGFLDEEGNKTRSGMYYEGIRILRKKKPSLSIIENVKNLTGKKFKKEFEMVLSGLDEAGYNSYYKVLNAKDYGVPQNRERVFIISIRKDLDNGKFKFPEPFDNGIRLKDVLEDEVDEKYYLSDDKVKRFITNLNSNSALLYDPCQAKREGKSREYNDYCPILTSRDYKDPRLVNDNVVKQIGNIAEGNGSWSNPQTGRIYSPDGCSPTLNTCGGGQREPKIIQVGRINSSQDGVVVSPDGIAKTHTSGHNNTPKIIQICVDKSINNTKEIDFANCITSREDVEKRRRQLIFENGENVRIRKLIPLECFRLMGFADEEFFRAMIGLSDKANEFIEQHPYLIGKTILDEAETIQGISNSQLYKQSGNSIVVDVLYYIYIELYRAMPYLFDDLRLSSFFSGIGAFESALDRLFESIRTGNFTRPQVE